MFFVRTRNEYSKPLDPLSESAVSSTVRHVVKDALGEEYVNAGNPCGPHSLRHRKVLWLLTVKEWSPMNVQTYMGHSTLDQTLRYAPLGVEQQAKDHRKANGNGSTEQPVTFENPSLKTLLEAIDTKARAGMFDSVQDYLGERDEAIEKYGA
jgi:hypothetical protein